MLLAGTNFGLYFLLMYRQWRAAAHMEEVRWYYIVVFAATLFISLNLLSSGQFHSVREVLFQVASIITTTGYATTDFDLWPSFSKGILLFLMVLGACAGSTGGGIKVSRLLIYIKTGVQELRGSPGPGRCAPSGWTAKSWTGRSVTGAPCCFWCAMSSSLSLSLLIVQLENLDLETSFSAVAATLNNIGPGLGLVGPTCNYSFHVPAEQSGAHLRHAGRPTGGIPRSWFCSAPPPPGKEDLNPIKKSRSAVPAGTALLLSHH